MGFVYNISFNSRKLQNNIEQNMDVKSEGKRQE